MGSTICPNVYPPVSVLLSFEPQSGAQHQYDKEAENADEHHPTLWTEAAVRPVVRTDKDSPGDKQHHGPACKEQLVDRLHIYVHAPDFPGAGQKRFEGSMTPSFPRPKHRNLAVLPLTTEAFTLTERLRFSWTPTQKQQRPTCYDANRTPDELPKDRTRTGPSHARGPCRACLDRASGQAASSETGDRLVVRAVTDRRADEVTIDAAETTVADYSTNEGYPADDPVVEASYVGDLLDDRTRDRRYSFPLSRLERAEDAQLLQ